MMAKRLPSFAVFLLAGALYLAGILAPLDRALTDIRFRLVQRPATGDLVFVQIDARSLQELGVWPLPREFHAELIERLFAAGVRRVALDIDLSARSNAEAEQALANVLQRHEGQVILPVFRQAAAPGTGNQDLIDAAPLPLLRRYAQLGAVNMAVESDGLVRRVSSSIVIEDLRHAAMFALLAGPAYLDTGTFLIDYAIDPWSIPRYSYVDVLRGNIPPEVLAGKQVIIGSGAAELGDNIPVPVYRNLPGPVVQALAFESLVQDRAIRSLGAFFALAIGAVLCLVLGPYFNRVSWQRGALIGCAVVIGLEAVAIAVQVGAPVGINTTFWSIVVILCFAQSVFRVVALQELQLFRQRTAMTYRRALMNLVVQDSFDGIIITDSFGNTEVFNKTAASILGYSAGRVIGRPLQQVFPAATDLMGQMSDQPSTTDESNAVIHLGPYEIEIERPDGSRITIELVVSRLMSRHSRRPAKLRTVDRQVYNFTFRNVTDRAMARIAEQKATEEARAANRAKSEFLANMSHELRTPLNAILGFSDTIKSEIFGPIAPAQYVPYIKDIHNCGQHLLEIINDILEVSRVELGQVRFNEEVVDLKAIATAACRILSGWPASAERKFNAEIAASTPGLVGDPRLIKQILVNLLSNAVKYSRPGDRVVFRVFVDPSGAPTVEVEDSGIGIDPTVIPFLTQPFYQVDGSLARSHEGTGLGLCLVSAYVDLHDGKLTIESQLGAGTKVSVRFPQDRVSNLTEAADLATNKVATA